MAEEPENTEETEAASPSAEEEPEPATPEEAAAEPDVAPAAEAAQEVLAPKERRRRTRAEKAAAQPARDQRSPEQRQQERQEERSRKAAARRAGRARARAKRRGGDGDGQVTPARERQPGVQKTRQGIVVSDAPDKTITVRIDITRRHREYKKIVRTSNTLHVHDERNDAHVGDTVVVRECRPLSRTKRWRLVEVLERAE